MKTIVTTLFFVCNLCWAGTPPQWTSQRGSDWGTDEARAMRRADERGTQQCRRLGFFNLRRLGFYCRTFHFLDAPHNRTDCAADYLCFDPAYAYPTPAKAPITFSSDGAYTTTGLTLEKATEIARYGRDSKARKHCYDRGYRTTTAADAGTCRIEASAPFTRTAFCYGQFSCND